MWVEETKSGSFKFVEQYKDYMTGKNKRVSITLEKNTAATRRNALEELTRKIDEQFASVGMKDITLEQLVAKYRTEQEKMVKQSTYRRNVFSCNTLMQMIGKDTIVNRITAPYLKDIFIASGKGNGTLNELRIRLKALLNWGFANDLVNDVSYLIKFKPFADVPHKVKIQDKYMESSEVKNLLKHIEENELWHWRYLTEFIVLSGLRFGETAALLISDIDYTNSVIHVTKTYDPNNHIVTTTKTACSTRDVYMQPELVKLCKKISIYMKEQKMLYGFSDTEKLFFQSKTGAYLEYYAYEKFIKKASTKALGRVITSHALRHTHASLLFEQGIGVDVISRRLGHENSTVTREIYLHITKVLEKRDNEKIAAIKII